MRRRNFISNLSGFGVAVGLSGGAISSCSQIKETSSETSFAKKKVIEKVKLAMLSMQRATWEQGVAMQALMEAGDNELVILMAKDAVLRQKEDGRVAMLGEEFALSDAASPGEAILFAAKLTGDEKLQAGFDKLLDYIINKAPRTDEGIYYHFTNIPQIWSDINYMLPPFLACAGKYEEAIKQIRGFKECLWDDEKKMLSHMWDCEKKEFPRKDFWGVGNGWTAAGLSRVIFSLPERMRVEKAQLIQYQKELIDGCLVHQRPDGFFHDVIDNPQSFVETNLGQMLAYSIYKGITGGWIDVSYQQYADKMRSAAHSKVDEFGLVHGVCGSPDFLHSGTATEGQAFFILMETAYQQLGNENSTI
ncbi:MAG: glycoside hydrolase family 88 protein [Prolixibacteraceae bacterium]|jgi:rhamnogalacturonyl hydrolase YesR|nr:glycoside hydrolase family 88 protein [Prolixibacteraceae bacterium]